MKQIFYLLLTAAISLTAAGCGTPASDSTSPETTPPAAQQEIAASSTPAVPESAAPAGQAAETSITLTVGGQTFSVSLEDSETAREFAATLPLTLDMSELNGNEKYFYMDSQFPTDAFKPGQIHEGDLMLYGNNCIVLFYETLSSSYSYTRLGNIDHPEGLAAALGAGDVSVTFSANS